MKKYFILGVLDVVGIGLAGLSISNNPPLPEKKSLQNSGDTLTAIPTEQKKQKNDDYIAIAKGSASDQKMEEIIKLSPKIIPKQEGIVTGKIKNINKSTITVQKLVRPDDQFHFTETNEIIIMNTSAATLFQSLTFDEKNAPIYSPGSENEMKKNYFVALSGWFEDADGKTFTATHVNYSLAAP